MRKGFTLLELIVVIIIIGILATLGVSQYTKLVEKGKTAEAKTILGQIKTAQAAYSQEYGSFAAALSLLPVSAPTGATVTHYFTYGTDTTTATATRVTTTAGKGPAGETYSVTMNLANGTWDGSAGYY